MGVMLRWRAERKHGLDVFYAWIEDDGRTIVRAGPFLSEEMAKTAAETKYRKLTRKIENLE